MTGRAVSESAGTALFLSLFFCCDNGKVVIRYRYYDKKENLKMDMVKLFFLPDCPYCVRALRAISELCAENPAYVKIDVEKINERQQPEIADSYDYYYVPTFFYGDEKLFEAKPGMSYEVIREQVKGVFDMVLSQKAKA